MSDELLQKQGEGIDAEPERPMSRRQVLPEALAGWHRQILESLRACQLGCQALDPSLVELLASEREWIDSLHSTAHILRRVDVIAKSFTGRG